MNKYLIVMALLWSMNSNGQDCDCESYYTWVRETFEQNDAGFHMVIDKKGVDAYAMHNALIEERISGIKDLHTCVKLLRDWVHFFRKQHVDVVNINTPPNSPDVVSYDVDLDEFKRYLSSKSAKDIEGIWNFDGSEIIFKKVDDNYLGIVNVSSDTVWKKGEVQFLIKPDGRGDYFNWEKSRWHLKSFELMSDDLLKINSSIFLTRSYPKSNKDSVRIANYLRRMNNSDPIVETYNDSTCYLKIPSFNHTEKAKIDSVINEHRDKLFSTKNLIIDLRGNGGGSDKSYESVTPLIYTNPIRSGGTEFRSTELNNQRTLDIISGMFGELTEEEIIIEKERFETLSANLGEFVNFTGNEVTITELEEIHGFPKEVAIIIDNEVASTAEEFLLDAKQSKKVKVFGVPTKGALDVANQYYTLSSDKEVLLVYTLSKRIHNLEIDDIGIQPDFYLDESMPIYGWIDFVAGQF